MKAPYLALGLAFLLGVPLTAAARTLAPRLGLVDHPGSEPHKKHRQPVPYGGGPALLLAATLATVAALAWERSLILRPHSNPVSEADWWHIGWLAAGAFLLTATGLWDDMRPLSPRTKLIAETAVITAVVLAGDVRVTLFIPVPAVGAVITVLWLLLVTNAVNLLDNHDGLAGGVAAIAAVFVGILCLNNGEEAAAVVLFALAGGLLAFLAFNFPPASIYLGDAGSLPVGFLLAGMCVLPAFYRAQDGEALPVAVLAPVFVLAVPLFDTLRVMALRAAAGKPLFQSDRRHFSHRLAGLGFRPREVAGIHYLLALLTGGSAVLLPRVEWQGACLLLAQLVGTLTLVVILERGPGGRDG